MSENPIPAPDLADPQLRAIEALVAGASHTRAARTAGVTPRTLQRWFKQPAFVEALYVTRSGVWSEITGVLQEGALRGATALVTTLASTDPRVRIAAARNLLQLAAQAMKTEVALYRAVTRAEAPAAAEQPVAEQPAVEQSPASSPPNPVNRLTERSRVRRPVPPYLAAVESRSAQASNVGKGATKRDTPGRSPLRPPLLASRMRQAAGVSGVRAAPPASAAPAPA